MSPPPTNIECELNKPPTHLDTLKNSVVNHVNTNFLTSIDSNKLTFYYTNASSLVNKRNIFNALLIHLELPHIVLVTETWYNTNSITTLENYQCFLKNRTTSKGGGVAIYIRNDILSHIVTDMIDIDIEHIWCHVKSKHDSILIGCIYRPPLCSLDYSDAVNKAINIAKSLCDKKKYSGLIIAGDFNYPHIKWSNDGGYYGNDCPQVSLCFLDTINENYLSQHVLVSTFGSNILDLLFTDDPSRIYSINV